MGLWQKITGALRHAGERRAAPPGETDDELSRQPSYEELERDKDRKEALTTGVGYGMNNERAPARRQFEEELKGPFGSGS